MYKFRESLGVKKYAPMEAGKFAEFLATAAAEVRNDWSIANDPESLKLVKGAEFAAKMSPASFLRTYLRLAGTMSASTLSGNVSTCIVPSVVEFQLRLIVATRSGEPTHCRCARPTARRLQQMAAGRPNPSGQRSTAAKG